MRWFYVILTVILLVGCQQAAELTPTPKPTPTATPIPLPTVDLDAAGTRFVFTAGGSMAEYTVQETFLVNSQGEGATSAGPAVARGVTSGIEGVVVLDLTAPQPVVTTGEITADLRLLASNDERRDLEVNRNWLETAVYPLATFVPLEARGFSQDWMESEPITFELFGLIEIRGIVREVVFLVEAELSDGVLTGTAETDLLMTDFGFDPPEILGIVRAENEVALALGFTAVAEE